MGHNGLVIGWLQFQSSGQERLLMRMALGQNLEASNGAIEIYGETDSRPETFQGKDPETGLCSVCSKN